MSKRPFEDHAPHLSDALRNMSYDQWRGIRFKPGLSLWRTDHFSAQFFHLGFLYQQPVVINYIDRKGTHKVAFSPDLFQYADKELKKAADGGGFAGFRIHYPLNTPAYADELAVFLGASYFRALARGQVYGMSARGLAIDTAQDTGEEMPFFSEFWIVHPSPWAKSITIYALLDSQSVTGAYRFIVQPGTQTIMKVNSELFFRRSVKTIGIAPLNSMFFYGENSDFRPNDFRPEVHDSDGLLEHLASGEWIWHPLVNPSKLLINAFSGKPLGFGLLQRDIDFDHYQDLEARYDLRPSVWVRPQNDWGKGHLELIQIPADTEYNDNIVAFWAPQRSFQKGDRLKYAYTLSWFTDNRSLVPLGHVHATRIVRKAQTVMFIIDFDGDKFKRIIKKITPVPDVWIGQGAHLTDLQSYKNDATGGWRLVLHVQLDAEPPSLLGVPVQKPAIELRAFLKDKASALSETWSYTYLP
ncbi:MAG: glucan biosynthesis protein [Candidatus Omnitrophica bacterium]|nr:glucan biosynthesis protein [Candidatus Omnitrophota bacterium]MDE2223448.1 glucan biosynthesis protein [Candidatus Omnitrophota bacterium]